MKSSAMSMAILVAALIAFAAAATSCTSANDANNALAGAGYTNVRLTGYRWFSCGKGDSFHTGFEAVGPTGRRVTGCVCSGWLKGSTIRID